jgi:hypothetical protein
MIGNNHTKVDLMENYLLNNYKKVVCAFNDYRLSKFLNDYQRLNNKTQNQYFNYWGINFLNGNIHSIKFYAHVFSAINQSELLLFLPNFEDYEKYSVNIKTTPLNDFNSVGTVLELKLHFDNMAFERQGFFFLVNSNLNNEIADNHIGLHINDYYAKGINIEYQNGKRNVKQYYYLSHNQLLDIYRSHAFQSSIFIPPDIPLYELSVSEKIKKINFYGIDFTNSNFMKNILNEEQIYLCRYINEKFNLINFGLGFYDNDNITSTYFFDASIYNKRSNNYFNVRSIDKVITRL